MVNEQSINVLAKVTEVHRETEYIGVVEVNGVKFDYSYKSNLPYREARSAAGNKTKSIIDFTGHDGKPIDKNQPAIDFLAAIAEMFIEGSINLQNLYSKFNSNEEPGFFLGHRSLGYLVARAYFVDKTMAAEFGLIPTQESETELERLLVEYKDVDIK